MADGTVSGRFELDAEQPIRSLGSIRDAGRDADAALRDLGGTMDRLPLRAQASWTATRRVITTEIGSISRSLDELDYKLDRFASKTASAKVELSGYAHAREQLAELERQLDRFDRRRATASVGIGGGFSNMAGGGSSGGFGLSPMAGLIGAGVALAPGLLGGAGSLLASAGSGALGAGVLGLAGMGTIIPGALIASPMIKQSITELGALTKAQNTYTTAVQSFGQASTQARTAKLAYDRALASSPAGAAGAARQYSALRSEWSSYTSTGIYGSEAQVLANIRRALPQIGPLAQTATGVTGRSAAAYSGFLTDPQSIRSYQSLVAAFTQDLPIIENTAQNLTRTFLNLAVTAQPFFHDALQWVDHWTAGLARSSGDTTRVSSDMSKMVTSARDWGHLLLDAGRTLRDLFSPAVTPGNNMVTSLDDTLKTWDQWLRNNPQKLQTFFRDGEQSVSRIATVIGHLTHDVWQLLQYLQPIFTRGEQFLQFASSLGGGNLALGGALLYGGYRGIQGALGGRGPGFGGALSTFIMGPGALGMRGPAASAAAAQETMMVRRASQAEFQAGITTSGALMMGPATVGPAAVLARRQAAADAALAGRSFSGSRLGRLVTGLGDTAAGARGMDLLGGLGGVARGFLGGAARFALPVLGISALLQGLSGGGSPTDHLARGLSSLTFGVVPPRTVASLMGPAAGAVGVPLAAGGSRLVSTIAGQGIGGLGVGGAAATLGLGVLGAYGSLMLNPDNAGLSTQFVQGQQHRASQALVGRLSAASTVPSLLALRRDAARQLQALPWSVAAEGENQAQNEAKMRKFLERLMRDASDKAGGVAASSWIDSLQTGLTREGPKAIRVALKGMRDQIDTLGPEGGRAFASDIGQWVHQMEIDYPKLRSPLEKLMGGIVGDLNRLNHTTGSTMKDLQDKIFFFNGQILKGSAATWKQIGDSLTQPMNVAQEHLKGIFGLIQSEAISTLSQMGFSPAQARQIVTSLAGGGSFQSATQAAGALLSHAGAVGAQIVGATHHARGGSITGAGLMDTVMLPDGSMAAPGEAWIANRHTMRALDLAAMEKYGKPAWEMIRDEPRPHSAPVVNYNRHDRGGRYYTVGGPLASLSLGNVGHSTASGASYVFPFSGLSRGRTDQGTDWSGAGPLLALGDGTVVHSGLWPGWPGTGGVVYRLNSGPDAGQNVYYMEHVQSGVGVGQPVRAGQPIATLLSGYPWLEAGWANAAGTGPLTPYNGAPDGTPMPGGINFGNFIAALQGRGRLPSRMGGAAGALMPSLSLRAPRSGLPGLPGVMADQASRIMTLGLQTAVNRRIGATGGAAGGRLSGPVEQQVYQFFSRQGFNRIAIAGMLGNAYQESGDNPNAAGGGMWQQISNFGSGTGGSLLHQMVTMLPQITGLRSAMNAAGSPGAAAVLFEQGFERAGIPAMSNRISAAQSAYAAGYGRGGRWPAWGGWNWRGGEFVTNGPTVFGAGDRQREHVSITPVGRGGGQRQLHVHFHGPIAFSGDPNELDKIAQYVAGKIADELDGPQDGHDNDLIGAPA